MKKILFMAVSAVLLAAGCQKTEIVNPVGEPTMNFSAKMGKLTKAGTASDGVEKLQNQHFKVWAYTTWTDPINNITPGLVYKDMANLDVTYENGSWGTEYEYYWPGKGLNLNFFALSSKYKNLEVNFNKTASDSTIISTAGDSTATRVMNVVSYTVDHENPIDDLMVADFVHQNQSKKDVTLKFRHALSKVEFLFKTSQKETITNADSTTTDNPEYREVKIDTVKVAGIYTTAGLTVTETVDTTAAAPSYVCTWNDLASPEVFVSTDSTFVIDPNAEPQTFATWLVLPQHIAATDEVQMVNLTVEIDYWMGDNKQTTSFPISTSTLTAWEPNQYIRYIVDITPALIKFTPEVEDWELADPVNNGN